jgi:RNA polymerase sigma-70 factor (ECF subfamily)
MTPPPQVALDSTLELLDRARQGDRAALELIAGRYQSALKRFAHGRLPAAARGLFDTDDIVQMAIVGTLGRIERFEPTVGGSLLGYLRRAVLNRIRDEIRRVQRRPRQQELSPDLPALGMDPLEQAISNEALERYEAALSLLQADQQEAFLMRIEMGCSYAEIADALGRPSAEAARLLVRRAIQALVQQLRRTRVP